MSEVDDGETPNESAPAAASRNWLLLPAFVIGWTMIAFGVTQALGDARDAHPFALLVHVVSFDIVHDAVLAPIVVVVGWLLGRLLPKVARGPVRTAVAISALLLVFAYPLIRRWGRRPTNSSTLPLAYGTNVVILLTLVWVIAAAVIGLRIIRRTDSE